PGPTTGPSEGRARLGTALGWTRSERGGPMDDPSARTPGITVLVLSDPGRCTGRTDAVREQFEEELVSCFGSATVHLRSTLLGINGADTLEFGSIHSLRDDYDGVDAVLILTEMPRR